MSRSALRAYISGPLQAAADLDAARVFYERLAAICVRAGFDPYVPHQRTDPLQHADVPPASVFERDMEAQRGCDVVVAHIGAPSSGVGAELAFAYQAAQPTIGIWSSEERPSRFLLGMLEDHPHAWLVAFDAIEELDVVLLEALEVVQRGLAGPT
jgi:nucleoside 2-deoxyribosyltransferase